MWAGAGATRSLHSPAISPSSRGPPRALSTVRLPLRPGSPPARRRRRRRRRHYASATTRPATSVSGPRPRPRRSSRGRRGRGRGRGPGARRERRGGVSPGSGAREIPTVPPGVAPPVIAPGLGRLVADDTDNRSNEVGLFILRRADGTRSAPSLHPRVPTAPLRLPARAPCLWTSGRLRQLWRKDRRPWGAPLFIQATGATTWHSPVPRADPRGSSNLCQHRNPPPRLPWTTREDWRQPAEWDHLNAGLLRLYRQVNRLSVGIPYVRGFRG